MPKNSGGKIAKKMARKSELVKPELPERLHDQYWGRVIRNLGNSQVMVYRNDAEEVICSLPGRLKRKRIRIAIGDIVLISMREGLSLTNSGKEMGDVLDKVDPTLYGKLKRDETFNQRLLNNLESLTTGGGGAGGPAEIEEDDFFIRDGEEDDDGDESDSSEASHDSRKKNRRITAGRARKEAGEFSNADIDRI
jgi:initiation factor 1A